VRGSDPLLDEAIVMYPKLESFLLQDMREQAGYGDSVLRLQQLLRV
jgi:flagellum-specific ATP synthase